MNLLPKSPAQAIAEQIDQINVQTIGFLKSQAKAAYDLANTPSQEQAIMDAFGKNAARALSVYAAIYQTLAALGEADELTAPDYSLFAPQADGTVIYNALSEPEPSE
jgi:ABC-type hemin transport system substrate-binding protein